MTEPVDCPICFDCIGDKNNITTECGHKFHASCLMTNITRNGFSCPCCRSVMAEEEDEGTELDDDDGSDDDDSDDDTSTMIDDSNEPYSMDALRALRFLSNRLEGVEDEPEDVYDEYQFPDEEVPLPSISYIIQGLRDKRVTYEQLAMYLVFLQKSFEDDEDLDRNSADLWCKLRDILDNYVPPPAEEPQEEPQAEPQEEPQTEESPDDKKISESLQYFFCMRSSSIITSKIMDLDLDADYDAQPKDFLMIRDELVAM